MSTCLVNDVIAGCVWHLPSFNVKHMLDILSFIRLTIAFVCPRYMSRANFKPGEIFGPQMLPKWLFINKTTNIFWRKAVGWRQS